ncbi:MAG: hypothetical protein WBD41_28000 [Rhodococcus sp. (in: high G+C Gram-positive bacteria)]
MKRTLLAVTGCAVVALSGCSSEPAGPELFTSRMTVVGLSNSATSDSCTFEEGTVESGYTALVVRGADAWILAKQDLRLDSARDVGTLGGPVCTFRADVEVPVGEAAYEVDVEGLDASKFEAKLFTEQELRGEAAIQLHDAIGFGLAQLQGG